MESVRKSQWRHQLHGSATISLVLICIALAGALWVQQEKVDRVTKLAGKMHNGMILMGSRSDDPFVRKMSKEFILMWLEETGEGAIVERSGVNQPSISEE